MLLQASQSFQHKGILPSYAEDFGALLVSTILNFKGANDIKKEETINI